MDVVVGMGSACTYKRLSACKEALCTEVRGGVRVRGHQEERCHICEIWRVFVHAAVR